MLRQLIIDQLSKISPKWWRQRVPRDIWELAEKVKEGERVRSGSSMNMHPIWYINFSEYKKILLRGDNWNQSFKSIFKNKSEIEVWLRNIIPIRNKVAHMRPLSSRERGKLEALSQDILVRIWDHLCNKPYIAPAKEYIEKGSYSEAENLLLKGLEITGEDPWIAYHLGELYEDLGRLEEAKRWFKHSEKYLVISSYKNKANKKLEQVVEKIRMSKIKICTSCNQTMPKDHSYCSKCGERSN